MAMLLSAMLVLVLETGIERLQTCRLAHSPDSGADFIHKMKVAMKELAETRMWLRVIAASGYLDAKRLEPLVDESLQLSRIIGASVATARRRLREEGEDLE